MTAKEYLSQAYQLDQRIQSKRDQIISLENMARNCTSTITGVPRSPSPSLSPMEDAICKMIDVKNSLDDELAQLLILKVNIFKLIHNIENLEYQLILEKRYLKYQHWEEIACDLHYSVGWVLKLHRKSLGVVDEVLAERGKQIVKSI